MEQKYGDTALHIAAAKRKWPTQTQEVVDNRPAIVEALTQAHGININAVDKVRQDCTTCAPANNLCDKTGTSALSLASYFGHLATVNVLIAAGADVNSDQVHPALSRIYIAGTPVWSLMCVG